MTENHAIRLCLQHRDPEGFEFLVSAYRREAFMHAMALLGCREDAEDACQECFSKAFRALAGLPALDRFYPWFYRILRNHCLNLLARRDTRQRHADDVAVDCAPAPPPNPESGVWQRDDRSAVHGALARLSPEHREILAMKYFENLNYAEIALRLGIPRGTVMSRLYHARRGFQRQYGRQQTAAAGG